ncbi:phosphotransferase family protein [Haladaptatus pallidirubidus]|uniref:Phosphotransferase family protein n=1 Tax=Haladaptatus pallidirubidus TaxID=1008152 RepID=A0AAV3UR49_9EURY|nr:phosphotransferase family protein [Haladaptatus pallidirubidus]
MTDDHSDEEYFERLVDKESLQQYLQENLGEAAIFEIEQHQAGHSNETLFLTWGDQEYVIRRPPPGETAEKAHDVLREYKVVSALQDTDVPLPETILECDDTSIIGSDFYLTDRLHGDVIRNSEPERFATPEARAAIGKELVDSLVAIHEVDYEEVGLGDFGYPEGFTERQVNRWTKQLDWAFEVTTDVRDVPLLDDVGDWLSANLPEENTASLVHGDYKLDNVMYAPTMSPEIVAVFDWELSALGNPFTDLGWMLAFWRDSGDPEPAVPELVSTVPERPGYMTRAELVKRYERKTGVTFEQDRFYRTLAVYKLAGLGEMFFRRHLDGNSDDSLYPVMENRVPRLAERAMRIINGEEPL